MKHLNLIGSSLTAALCISVIAACDSRGVTAMKSRTYSPEEIAAAKLQRQGQSPTSKKTDSEVQGPIVNPNAGADAKGKPADETVSDQEAGAAQSKMFTEGRDGFQASKSELLTLAKAELGKVSKSATDILKGITIYDKSVAGKTRISFDAIMMPEDHALSLSAEFDVDTNDQDVVNGKSDTKVQDISGLAETETDPSRIVVATICVEADKSACKKVILVFSVAYGQKAKIALVEVTLGKPGQVPNAVLVTNAGLLKTFEDAQIEIGGKMPEKSKSETATPGKATISRPAVPFKDEAKTMSYKQFAARYADWKKTQANADQWSKHVRPTAKPEAAPVVAPKVDAPKAEIKSVPTPETAKPQASKTPQMPTDEQAKNMTKTEIAEATRAYERSIAPITLPQEAKDAVLKLGKGDDKVLVETKAQSEAKALVAEKNEYDKLPLYKKPFTKFFWYGSGRLKQLTSN